MKDAHCITDAYAKLVLGIIGPEDLPHAAAEAMEAGLDSPSLRLVAALSPVEILEARSHFSRALEEVGVPEMTKRDAVSRVAKTLARELLSGNIPPIDAANRIWTLSLQIPDDEQSHKLDAFIYAASEWDDRPEDRSDFERGIVESARKLLDE